MREQFQLWATNAIAFATAACATVILLVSATHAGTPPATQPHAPAPKVFELAIVNGRMNVANSTIRVKKDDQVELRWSSDRAMSLHLHGYDIERAVGPQAPATMTFKAKLTGRFPVSEHGHGGRHGRALLYLEVHP